MADLCEKRERRRGPAFKRALKSLSFCLLLFAVAVLAPSCCRAESTNPFDETIRILERWTVTHWGRDCFVWIVYYPEELIDPWVDAEALRVGMSGAERRSYRETFVSELRMGKAEPFLMTVYSFGARPVSFAPVSENVLLVTSSGERLRPVRYDVHLDQPLSGIVQGLIFFPKQADTDFAVAVKGMGIHDERLFSFASGNIPEAWPNETVSQEAETVVVELPKKPAPRKVSVRPVSRPQPVEHPAVPMAQPPAVPRPIPPLLAEDSGDMALFVESMRDRSASAERRKEEDAQPPEKNTESAYVSREQVLRQFLNLWADNRPAEMYVMLSDPSRKMLTSENFAKEVAKAADFRAGLKDGYRIDWVGEERAKVIADRRFLMFRSLVIRTLGVVREGSSWKIVW